MFAMTVYNIMYTDCCSNGDEATTESANGGGTEGTLYVSPEGSLLEPRGKFVMTLRSNGLLVDGKSGNCFLPWTQVNKLISLPNPSSTKKDGERLLFFILNQSIAWGKRQLKIICWNLSQAKSANELQVSYGPLHFKGKIVCYMLPVYHSHLTRDIYGC